MSPKETFNVLCFVMLIASLPFFGIAIKDGEMWPLRLYVLMYWVVMLSAGSYLCNV